MSLPRWRLLILHKFVVAVEIVFKIHNVGTKYFLLFILYSKRKKQSFSLCN